MFAVRLVFRRRGRVAGAVAAGVFVVTIPGVAVASGGLLGDADRTLETTQDLPSGPGTTLQGRVDKVLDDPVEGVKDTVWDTSAPVRDTLTEVTKPVRQTLDDVVGPVTDLLDDPSKPITDVPDPLDPTVLPPVDPDQQTTATDRDRPAKDSTGIGGRSTTSNVDGARARAGATTTPAAPVRRSTPAARLSAVVHGGQRPSTVADAVADATRAFRFPLLLAAAVALFLAVQNRLDRRDPRLRSGPADLELTFA